MDLKAYLSRFAANHLIEPSLNNLIELQSLHMRHIPFENLDVIRRTPIYLNLETIYNKIVVRNRGGYCYELNGLFQWLLEQLGYEASLVSATVYRPDGQWAKADTHAAILVQLDEPYLVDVGFGDSTILPIPLNGLECTDVSGAYKVEPRQNDQFDLIQTRNCNSRTLYRFNKVEKLLIEFHEGCVFNQVAKESSFTHRDLVTIATATGRITLIDHQLTHTENGKMIKTTVTSDEKARLLHDLFGILV